MNGRALSLLRIGLTVADISRAQAYYCTALGFTAVAEKASDPSWIRLLGSEEGHGRTARLRLGAQELELIEFDPSGAEYPPDSTAADLWFQHFAIVTNDMTAAFRRLERHGTTSITQGGPQRLPPAAGAVLAYKFRDPDGHPLELIHFPPGIGQPAWHRTSPDVTRGIDHSALSVADAGHSLAFYGALGLVTQSRQLNSGPAQDRLDGLANTVVDVIGLAPAAVATPHVELLCYRTPRGRPCRPGRQAGDIADSRLIFQVEDLTGLIHTLASSGVVTSPVSKLASGSLAALVRDPDGHALVLLENP